MSEKQTQSYTIAVAAAVIGLILGYLVAGALRGPQGDAELQAQLKQARDTISNLEAQLESIGNGPLQGDLFISGSSTVFPVADLAAEDFQNLYPDVNVQVEGPGSGAGVAKASDGTADIGMASRNVKTSELLNTPTLITFGVAKDSVSVVINPENPLAGRLDLSIEQVHDIFAGEITNWSTLGGDDHKINVYTREEGSGTRGTFMDFTDISEGEFVADASVQQGNAAMRAAVVGDPNGIAYISLGYVDVTMAPARIEGIEGTIENVLSGDYPFQRILWMFTNGKPSALEQAYLDFVMSPQGQVIVEEEGFIPIY